MKRAVLAVFMIVALQPAAHAADETGTPVPSAPESLGAIRESSRALGDLDEFPFRRESLYTVTSDDLDASESLNRISGDIDLGFSLPSQSYKSSGHSRSGPFGQDPQTDSL